MKHLRLGTRLGWAAGCKAMLLALLCSSAWAQSPGYARWLGLSESELKSALPALERLAKPVWGPHRERGSYVLKNSTFLEPGFDATFYFKSGRVERVEQRQVMPWADCASRYEDLVQRLTQVYGVPAPRDLTGQSVAWQADTFALLFHRIDAQPHCELLLAFVPFNAVDASAL